MALKFDHPPLLSPGRHYMTLPQIEARCVAVFDGAARQHRERIYYAFEDLYQRILIAGLPCTVYVDGSFLTEKPMPDDVDVIITVDADAIGGLSPAQKQLRVDFNNPSFIPNVQIWAGTAYPVGHPLRGSAADFSKACEGFGLEHAKVWLKGYCVMAPGETDVGIRICY
jgi:hypothetical protein